MTSEQLLAEAGKYGEKILKDRRYLHAHPGTGFDLSEDGKAYIETTTYNEPNIRGRAFNQSLQGIHRDVKPVEADTVIVSVGYASNRELYDAIKGDNVHLLGDAERPSNLMGCIWSDIRCA